MAAILRLQIDTAMRANAFNLVDDPVDLANFMMEGNKISARRDRDGNKLRDYYLIEKLNEEFTWVKSVYEECSGAIHLSRRHAFAAMGAVKDLERSIILEVSGTVSQPHGAFSEIYEAFSKAFTVTYRVSFERWELGGV